MSDNPESRLSLMEKLFTRSPEPNYSNMDNNRLAVHAIGLLEENGMPRTQEAVTVALFLMFPDKFSLVGFPMYPDTERVNRTLLQLGPKYRNWVTGNRHVGYTLNDAGRHVLEQARRLLLQPELQAPVKRAPAPRTRDPEAEVAEIARSSLFRAYAGPGSPSPREDDFWELMQAFPYTPKRALRNRLREMREAARLASRNDLVQFLDWVRDTCTKYFEETDS